MINNCTRSWQIWVLYFSILLHDILNSLCMFIPSKIQHSLVCHFHSLNTRHGRVGRNMSCVEWVEVTDKGVLYYRRNKHTQTNLRPMVQRMMCTQRSGRSHTATSPASSAMVLEQSTRSLQCTVH
jgi:hypothetical protein